MSMLRHDEVEVDKLTASMKNKIREFFCNGGGIYRMNTPGAKYYEFTFYRDVKGKLDFTGSFHHSSISEHFSYVYDSEENKFIKQ